MKKILVPIDFSNNSHNAYLYARELATAIDADLTVFHVFNNRFKEKSTTRVESLKEKSARLQQQLVEFTDVFPDASEVATKLKMELSVIFDLSTIAQIVERSADFDLIIMGTRREHPIPEKVLGSVSSNVAQEANCPVLLVPKGAHFSGFEKIIYASNWESADKKLINEVIERARLFSADVDFVHISPEYEFKDFEVVKAEILAYMNGISKLDFTYTFVDILDNSTLRGMNHYARAEKADLIVLGNRQRNFLQNIFGRSLTKEMAMDICVPMLVFQLDKDALFDSL